MPILLHAELHRLIEPQHDDAGDRHRCEPAPGPGRDARARSAGIAVCAVETAPGAPAFASRWCAESSIVPDLARDPDAYVDSLLELCAQCRPRALIPCHDGTIDALRSRRDDLEQVVAVALAPEAPLASALDKRTTLGVAATLGVRVPRGETVTDAGDAGAALDETGLPAVIKPARSWAGSQRLVSGLSTTRAPWRRLSRWSTRALRRWCRQRLPGAREAVSFIYADGRFWARFAQRADRMYPPLGGSPAPRVSIPLPPDVNMAGGKRARHRARPGGLLGGRVSS